MSSAPRDLPFPESICHGCAAPPRYVRSATSTFILCPLLPRKYPPQPVLACPMYRPRQEDEPDRRAVVPEDAEAVGAAAGDGAKTVEKANG